jgi:NADPH2:quinone reductase
MRAVVMSRPGEPEVLEVQEVAKPVIREGREILIRLKAAGVNPVDTKLRSKGTYYPQQMPAILGCDGAGVVEAIGDEVRRFRPGEAVYFYHGGIGGKPGNYADYTVIDERFVVHKPSRLSFVEAAAAPLVLITAWESLHDRMQIRPGQPVLIHAGAGGVGHVAIQLAKSAGARVCTTVGSAAKAQFVEPLGADEAILYKETDFVQAVLNWTDQKGVALALDTVGGQTLVQTFSAVRHYGDLVTILQPPADTDWKAARVRNLRISLELMLSPAIDNLHDAERHQTWILQQCADLFEAGKLQVHVSQTFPLDEAAQAHRRVQQGSTTGKCVLVIEE